MEEESPNATNSSIIRTAIAAVHYRVGASSRSLHKLAPGTKSNTVC